MHSFGRSVIRHSRVLSIFETSWNNRPKEASRGGSIWKLSTCLRAFIVNSTQVVGLEVWARGVENEETTGFSVEYLVPQIEALSDVLVREQVKFGVSQIHEGAVAALRPALDGTDVSDFGVGNGEPWGGHASVSR